jgi:prepilin-type N-terminal cleavage/methylation domain-containing protein
MPIGLPDATFDDIQVALADKLLPNMITTTRRQPCPKAYTIIESLVVLVILTVITMVGLALLKYETAPEKSTGKAPNSAPAKPSPAARESGQPE